jgi:hypothetical protein
MPSDYKVLGQSKPSANTLDMLYAVPASTQTVVSSVWACNQSATPTTVRLAIAVASAADTPKQYLAYDMPIGAFESICIVAGLTLDTTDEIWTLCTLATVSFNAFGEEIT